MDLKPRDIITEKSLRNAMVMVMALGGSTNAVLHLIAIARSVCSFVSHQCCCITPVPHWYSSSLQICRFALDSG